MSAISGLVTLEVKSCRVDKLVHIFETLRSLQIVLEKAFYQVMQCNYRVDCVLVNSIYYLLCALIVMDGGYERLADDAYSSMAPDPTFALWAPCCPVLDFVYVVFGL
jgi:hypothetical protein